MISLNDEQREHLHEVTHDLMLLSACGNALMASLICDILGTLYGGVLEATEEETIAASDRANRQIREKMRLEISEGALH